MSEGLSHRLREGTKHCHTAAENTAFMKCFLKGVIEREPFRKLTANLYFVYSALEAEMERLQDHPMIQGIYFPELNRKAKLEQDLEYFYGPNWREDIHASDQGIRYVNHIHEVARAHPALLVAHAYVRYMGDLSGGQSLRNIARSAMDLPPDKGTGLHEFDQFPTVESRREFKARYRQALDSLTVDEQTAEDIVKEAAYVFQLNRNVFHELDEEVKAAVGDHIFDLITRQDKPGSTEREPGSSSVELVAGESA
jgi:heme oxygenase